MHLSAPVLDLEKVLQISQTQRVHFRKRPAKPLRECPAYQLGGRGLVLGYMEVDALTQFGSANGSRALSKKAFVARL